MPRKDWVSGAAAKRDEVDRTWQIASSWKCRNVSSGNVERSPPFSLHTYYPYSCSFIASDCCVVAISHSEPPGCLDSTDQRVYVDTRNLQILEGQRGAVPTKGVAASARETHVPTSVRRVGSSLHFLQEFQSKSQYRACNKSGASWRA
jgi:hypothetical protein